MKRWLIHLALGASLALTLAVPAMPSAGEAQMRTVVVRTAPPRARAERRPARPSADHVWIAGHWVHRNGRYVWRSGRWVPARAGYRYRPARWVQRADGWVFVEGRWARARRR